MKTQIELKSALLGLAIGALAVLAMGAATANPVGKYHVEVASTGGGWGGFAIVVDTQTGETWGLDVSKNWDAKSDKFWGPK